MALRKKNVAEITERKTSSECCYSVVLATERVAGFRSKATWHKLAFFALVRPADDLLPIRALYGEAGNTNIGLNPLTSDKPIWYAGPDFAASVLLTGRVPEIIEAFRI